MLFPNGESANITMKAGEAAWAPAGPHTPTNVTTGRSEIILVDLKNYHESEEMEDHDDDD